MRDELEILLVEALKPELSPPKELNLKILSEAKEGRIKKKKTVNGMNLILKAAVLIFAVFGFATATVSAGNYIYHRFFVTEVGFVYGGEDSVSFFENHDEDEVYYPTVSSVMDDVGDDTVKWYRKHVDQNDEDTLVTEYFYYDYSDMISDAMIDEWLPETITKGNTSFSNFAVIYSPGQYYIGLDIFANSNIAYKGGEIYICETWSRGNDKDPENYGYNVYIPNPVNTRVYTNKNGRAFTLIDEVRDDGKVITYTSFFYPILKYGYISFTDISEEDIYSILDEYVEPHVEDEDFVYPEKPGVEPITTIVPMTTINQKEDENEPIASEKSLKDMVIQGAYMKDNTVVISEDTVWDSEEWICASESTHLIVESGAVLTFTGLLDICGSITYNPGSVICGEGRYYLMPGAVANRGGVAISVENLTDSETVNGYAAEFGVEDYISTVYIWGGPGCKISFSGISREEFDNTFRINNIHRSTVIELNGEDITDSIYVMNYIS